MGASLLLQTQSFRHCFSQKAAVADPDRVVVGFWRYCVSVVWQESKRGPRKRSGSRQLMPELKVLSRPQPAGSFGSGLSVSMGRLADNAAAITGSVGRDRGMPRTAETLERGELSYSATGPG